MQHIKSFLESVNSYPFHMPGHKRNKALFPTLPLEQDITEIEGADNLHNPTGVIKNAMEEAARLWGAKRSYFLVNGSTCGILAGITMLAKRGDKVLCARNCHRSVFHALEVGGLNPLFITPNYIESVGVYGSLSPDAVEAALDGDKGIRLVIAVSPTFEGVLSDIKQIADICHERGVFLFVDEAHGAHLDLSPHFTGGAVAAGADIAVQSLHKTLPALTQTAILHVASESVDISRLEHKLRIFESSSPSYILMRSAEHAVQAAKNPALFECWAKHLDTFENDIKGLKNIKLTLRDENVFAYERSKLVFTGVNGTALCAFLRSRGIEVELATDSHLIAMTGTGDNTEGMQRLANALKEADALLPPVESAFAPPFKLPETVCGIEQALDAPSVLMPVAECVGKTAAEYVWAYPPGIPVLIPGEIIPKSFTEITFPLESDSRLLPQYIKVLC